MKGVFFARHVNACHHISKAEAYTHFSPIIYKKVSKLRAINKELQDGEKQEVEVNMYRASN